MPDTPPRPWMTDVQGRRWALPPDVHACPGHGSSRDPTRLRTDAARRRAALEAGGCQTFVTCVALGRPAIRCLCCGLSSANPRDLAQGWCPFCEAWHARWREDDA
jgi:hypothetical protein